METEDGKFSHRSLGLLIVVFLSAYSLGRSGGGYSPTGLGLYVLTFAAALFCVIRFDALGRGQIRSTIGTVLVLVVFWFHLYYQPKALKILYPASVAAFMEVRDSLTWLPLLGPPAFLFLWPRIPRVAFWIYLVILTVAVVYPLGLVIPVSPKPYIDVWYIYQEASEFILSGQNPYLAHYTNLYPDSPRYPEGLADIYAYPPLTIFLNLVGYAFGDVRWGLLGFHFGGCAFIFLAGWRAGLSPVEAFAISIMALAVPFNQFVIEQSWNEPFIVFFLGLVAFFLREKKLTATLLSAAFAISLKQYMVLFLAQFLAHRRKWSLVSLSQLGGVAALTYGIFFLIDPWAIYHDIVIHFRQTPFRPDALSILSWLHDVHGVQFPEPPNTVSFLVLLAGIFMGGAAIYFRARPKMGALANQDVSRAGEHTEKKAARGAGAPGNRLESFFHAGGISFFWVVFAGTFLAFVLSGKQAFTNYFYLFHILTVLALLFSRIHDREIVSTGH